MKQQWLDTIYVQGFSLQNEREATQHLGEIQYTGLYLYRKYAASKFLRNFS